MTQDERINDMVRDCMHQIRTRALRDAPVYLSHVSIAQHTLKISIKSMIEEAVAAERERLVAIIRSPELVEDES